MTNSTIDITKITKLVKAFGPSSHENKIKETILEIITNEKKTWKNVPTVIADDFQENII